MRYDSLVTGCSAHVAREGGGVMELKHKQLDAAIFAWHQGRGPFTCDRLAMARALEAAESAREVPAMPTREQLAADIREWYEDGRRHYPDRWKHLADCVLQLLAQRQQPAQAVWDREHARRLLASYLGDPEFNHDASVALMFAEGLEVFGSVCPSVPPTWGLLANTLVPAAERDTALRERDEARDCGQDGVCAVPPGCQRHWEERNRELASDLAEAREELHEYVTKWDQRESELLDVKEQLAAKEAEWQTATGHKTPIAAREHLHHLHNTYSDALLDQKEARKRAERVLTDTKARFERLREDAGYLANYVQTVVLKKTAPYNAAERVKHILAETAEPAAEQQHKEIQECTHSRSQSTAEDSASQKSAAANVASAAAPCGARHGSRPAAATKTASTRASSAAPLSGSTAETPEPAQPSQNEAFKAAWGSAKLTHNGEPVQEPTKPDVTLEALAKQVARHERSLRHVILQLGKPSWDDVRAHAASQALNTDAAAEAGKGEM